MLSKIKNMFSKETLSAESTLSDSFDHSKMSAGDATMCPFMKDKSKTQSSNSQQCPVTGKAVAEVEVDSDEEEKPRGGCPFMSGTSDKKKNPNLKLTEAGFDEPFVSKFRFYLSASKLDFSTVRSGLPQPTTTRDVFNNYPIYLQHSLFYNGEDYKKVRSIECCSRFMAYEQLREKGNKRFNKGKYYEALEFYERAMSLFRWLQYYELANESTVTSENHLVQQASLDELSENGSKVNIPLDEKSNPEDPSAGFQELKNKYKEFFITYCDENTRLYDGQEMDESADIDMRKSLLIQVYLNMCAAYIQTHHFGLAEKICDEGIALSEKVSQLYFRKAQALSLRKDASVQQLERAKKCINVAIQKRSSEKIFATANQNILKMLNLHDSVEAYEACRQHIENRISEVSNTNASTYSRVHERVKEIHENELRIIAQGKVPQESREEKVLENTTEMKILSRMAAKYRKVIEFYTEAKNIEQVALAKKEFQEVLRIQNEVKGLFDLELKENDGELGGLESEKIQARIAYVKTYFAEQIYNAGKFNYTMLEWAIKQIVKEEQEEKKKRLEAEKKIEQERLQAEGGVVPSKRNYGKFIYFLLLLPLLAILFNMYVL